MTMRLRRLLAALTVLALTLGMALAEESLPMGAAIVPEEEINAPGP